jgi:hypothetical protein
VKRRESLFSVSVDGTSRIFRAGDFLFAEDTDSLHTVRVIVAFANRPLRSNLYWRCCPSPRMAG